MSLPFIAQNYEDLMVGLKQIFGDKISFETYSTANDYPPRNFVALKKELIGEMSYSEFDKQVKNIIHESLPYKELEKKLLNVIKEHHDEERKLKEEIELLTKYKTHYEFEYALRHGALSDIKEKKK